jgi:hypothetical protein
MHALHPDIAPETNRCLLQSPFPETATINHRGHQRPLHINICSRFPSMVWHYPYGSLLLHPIKSIVQSLRTLSRASITIPCLALLCIMCRCTSRGAEPNQAIQSPQALCGLVVHLPALVIAVPPLEHATTARRSGRCRPPEFPSCIECICHWSKLILLGASPHQAAFLSECR